MAELVDCTGLENQRSLTAVQGFESLTLLFKYYIMKITTKYGTYEERELAQLIRRNMMSKVYNDKTKYNRKIKHKKCLTY